MSEDLVAELNDVEPPEVERRVDRVVFAVRRLGLLVLVVGCIVVPVVSIAANVLTRRGGSTQTNCPDPTTPCELPQVIPTGHAAHGYHADAATASIFGRLAEFTPLTWAFIVTAVLCLVLAAARIHRVRRA